MMKRFSWIMIILILLFALGVSVTLLRQKGYWLTYQVTPSMKKGFYWISPVRVINRYDIVLFEAPKPTLKFLKLHHWIPNSGLLMKKVYGVPGDFVCKRGHYVWINHKKIAYVYRYYAPNKLLPNKPFCEKLKKDHYLLMSMKVKRSFDGRYFGPVSINRIKGEGKYLK